MVNEKIALTETLQEQIIKSVKSYKETNNGEKPTARDTILYIFNTHSNVNIAVEDLKGILLSAGLHRSTYSKYINQLMDADILYEDKSGYLHKSETELSDIVKYLLDKHKRKIESGKTVIVDFQEEFGTDKFLLNKLDSSPNDVFKMFSEAYTEAYRLLKNEKPDCDGIVIQNLPDKYKCDIEDINSAKIGKVVEFEGIISIASSKKVMLKKGAYTCGCGNNREETLDNMFEDISKVWCKCGKEMMLNELESDYIDIQEIKLQQPLETMDNPQEPPKYITVFFENSPGLFSGKLNVIGIPFKRKQKNGLIYDIYIYAKSIAAVEDIIVDRLDENKITYIKQVVEYCSKNDIKLLDKLSEILIPTIHSHEDVKKALLLQQLKGAVGLNRNNLHILLVADPGVGKSEMLRTVSKLPKNIYGSITGSSGVGLTAAVEQERTSVGDSGWVTKPGLLVCKNGGTASLDELTVNKEMSTHLLEAMESQEIHISKAGLNICLPAEIAILAACNPRNGCWDNTKGLIEQIELTKPVIDRFDLIFDMGIGQNKELDAEIARKTIRNHNLGSVNPDSLLDKTIDIGDYTVNREFLLDFIEYTRTLSVKVPKSVEDSIVEYYVNRRANQNTSTRLVETIIRLSTAFAKARLDTEVNERDFKDACALYTLSIKVDNPLKNLFNSKSVFDI
ncbi:ATP-binding protein [Methanococcus maripaludis]|uniref:Replicative DNA helicase Mcm n=3 Tax=Methanococcus maripaludis TaxID=39152 RepID=A0A7J9PGM6_METMI|nr:ATP-binding protein [Methanococcus maripaludis]MBA2861830.1 replicative DNA helicase Mcm [Methanococcus maripaludis]